MTTWIGAAVVLLLHLGGLEAKLPVSYSTVHVSQIASSRTPRDAATDEVPVRRLTFTANDTSYNLELYHEPTTVVTRETLVVSEGRTSEDKRSFRPFAQLGTIFYSGTDLNDEKSKARIAIDDAGVLTGRVDYFGGRSLHIEPKWRHDPSADKLEMILYNDSSVTESEAAQLLNSIRCAEPVQSDVDEVDVLDDALVRAKRDFKIHHDYSRTGKDELHSNYSIANMSCSLLLVADYKFHRQIGGSNLQVTASYLIGLVDRINRIFLETDFSFNDHNITGIGFEIARVIIHEYPSPDPLHYNAERIWRVQDLLSAFSTLRVGDDPDKAVFRHGDYCLCHLFTYEDLEEGVMGMAYRAEEGRNQGLCSGSRHNRRYTSVLNMNTGITTMNNWGSTVLTQAADLVTGHELGHNLGSNHDPVQCIPSDSRGGPYMMHARAVSGKQANNRKFSECSTFSMGRILLHKSTMNDCLHPVSRGKSDPVCGNGRVEPGEECDEGVLLDRQSFSSGLIRVSRESGQSEVVQRCCNEFCQLEPSNECSDFNDECCRSCRFAPSSTTCQSANPCVYDSLCTGSSGQCPPAVPRPDFLPCVDHGMCLNGVCVSHCEGLNMTSCECDDESSHPQFRGERGVSPRCALCCRASSGEKCKPVLNGGAHGELAYIYPDHTLCTGGSCQAGQCVSNYRNDILQHVLAAFKGENAWHNLVQLVKQNVVMAVIFLSMVTYVPACCFIHFCIDQKILNHNYREADKFLASNQPRQIIEHARLDAPKSPSPLAESVHAWPPHNHRGPSVRPFHRNGAVHRTDTSC